ncbi:MAG: DUF2169 domain-containing protein [Polyangiaceae bacterium]|nr:DUF2169 domain-containing protein [Polyangiaceae bacterium]
MFVRNRTSHKVCLARAEVTEDLLVAAVTLTVAFRLTQSGLVSWDGPRESLSTDAPSTAAYAIWQGTGLTVSGAVLAANGRTTVERVQVRAADQQYNLTVFGDRTWIRNGGKLVISVPSRFEEISLSWRAAFGGGYDMPPGLDPIRKLPHPGGRVDYHLNPTGVGFYADDRSAEGKPLPNIERSDMLIQSVADRPRPGGLSPCIDLSALRVIEMSKDELAGSEWQLPVALRLLHHTHSDLIFADLEPGTPIYIGGIGQQTIRFSLPPSPVKVSQRISKKEERVGFRIRAIHVSAADGAVLVEYTHAFGCHPKRSPQWIHVDTI